MKDIRIRQGALVLTIDPLGRVTYEVSICVPKDYNHADKVYCKSRFMVKKQFISCKKANVFKIGVQISVQQHKNEVGTNRINRLNENLDVIKREKI